MLLSVVVCDRSAQPEEYFEEQATLRQERRDAKKRHKMDLRQAELNEKAAIERVAWQEAQAAEGAKKGRRSRKEREEEEAKLAAEARSIQAKVLTLDDVSDEEETEDEKEVPMYFCEPQQLLDIFTALEESNLFLIQNSQETEAALEELKTKFAETRTRMESEADGLHAQTEHLKQSIKVEGEKSKALLERAGQHMGVAAQEQTLDELSRKVAEVYRAIFSEADNSLSTLQMLTNIEARLEDLLSIIESMPQAEVEAAEKQKEKERRTRVRELKQAEQLRLQEERIQRSIRRSQEPVKRRTGKPIMFRSTLPERKKKIVVDDNKLSEEDDINFYLAMES